MATFNDRRTIDRLMANDGWLPECGDRTAPDNPPVIRIVEYMNMEGRLAWGVVFDGERDPYRYERPSEYIYEPRVIWVRSGRSRL
jgi:hypothetical protein